MCFSTGKKRGEMGPDQVVARVVNMLQRNGCLKEPIEFDDSTSEDRSRSPSPKKVRSRSPIRRVVTKPRSSRSSSDSPAESKTPPPESKSKISVPSHRSAPKPSPVHAPSPSQVSDRDSNKLSKTTRSSSSDSDLDYRRRKDFRVTMPGSPEPSGSDIVRRRVMDNKLSDSDKYEGNLSKKTSQIPTQPNSLIDSCPSVVSFTLQRDTDVQGEVRHLMADMVKQAITFDPNLNPILARLQTRNKSVCSYYQVGKCIKVSHKHKNKSVPEYMHICAFCFSKLKLAMGHGFKECPFVAFNNLG